MPGVFVDLLKATRAFSTPEAIRSGDLCRRLELEAGLAILDVDVHHTAMLGQPAARRVADFQRNALVFQLSLQLGEELVDDALDGFVAEATKLRVSRLAPRKNWLRCGRARNGNRP